MVEEERIEETGNKKKRPRETFKVKTDEERKQEGKGERRGKRRRSQTNIEKAGRGEKRRNQEQN